MKNIISHLYWNQSAKIKVANKNIDRNTERSLVAVPAIFQRYSKEIIKEALSDSTEGKSINREIPFADVTVIMTDNNDLQHVNGMRPCILLWIPP